MDKMSSVLGLCIYTLAAVLRQEKGADFCQDMANDATRHRRWAVTFLFQHFGEQSRLMSSYRGRETSWVPAIAPALPLINVASIRSALQSSTGWSPKERAGERDFLDSAAKNKADLLDYLFWCLREPVRGCWYVHVMGEELALSLHLAWPAEDLKELALCGRVHG